MSTSASVKALLNKFVDLRFEEDPFSCAPFGIRRFEDCFPDLGKAAMMGMREKLLELQSETREVASLPDLTSSEIADVAFLLDVIDSSLVTTGIPGEVGYAYELQNNHMTSIFSALEMVFQHYQRDDTREDLENYRKRLILTGPQFDNMIDGFRSGISRKITLNRDGVEMMIKKFSDSCGGFGTEEDNLDDSTAFARKSPLNKSEKALALTGDVDFLVPAIRDVVMKGYARARKFLEEEYLPHARQYPGIYGLPDYERQYANYVFTNTNVRYTASEIHELGLKEVARIEALMNQAKADCGFEGSLHEFHLALNDREKYPQLYFDSVDEVLPEYNRICQKAKEKMVDYFEVFPKFDCSVQAVPEFLEAQMPLALYMAGTPTKPGTFMANLRLHKVKPLHEKTALCLHEANPGHQFSSFGKDTV
ncbi:hypothetical protein HDU82_000369 [Entophlyctis luteolus]|nr:hypothetical protein HDU82_000369 [Entophlyctis luteolus]